MKVSLDWLKDYVEIDLSVNDLAEKLIHVGFNLESIIPVGDDTVLDLEVTSNRPDCLGHFGIAREISAITGKPMMLPEPRFTELPTLISDCASVEVISPDLCPRYTARVIRDVKVGPSPEWMIKRLEAIGCRSINNIVDITNYILFETGQPLHAFDYDKLIGHKIIVRPARPGEPFIAIDHSEHKLDSQTLVIADAERAVALAGVMGGWNTEVSDDTRNILLESAEFEPICIRRTARKLNLHSDSSYRFERRVDSVGVEFASRRAVELLAMFAEGKIVKGVIDVWQNPYKEKEVELKFQKIRSVLGIDVPKLNVVSILKGLGFSVRDAAEGLIVTIPSYRSEVTRPIDLVEEVGRIYGFDKIPIRHSIEITAVSPSKTEKITETVHRVMNQFGFDEAMTVSLVEPKAAALFSSVDPERTLRILGTRKMAADTLRCSLIPSLLMSRRHNQDAGNAVSDLYEISRVYPPGAEGKLPSEHRELAVISSDGDFRKVRGAIETLSRQLGLSDAIRFEAKNMEWFVSDQSAQILFDGKPFGMIGLINLEIQKLFDLKKSTVAASMDFEVLLTSKLEPVKYSPLPRFPAIERDLSIIVDETITWQTIDNAIRQLKISELEHIEFGELFRGKQIPKGQKSLFFTLRYRSNDRSLTHEEVDGCQQKVMALLEANCQAKLRMV